MIEATLFVTGAACAIAVFVTVLVMLSPRKKHRTYQNRKDFDEFHW